MMNVTLDGGAIVQIPEAFHYSKCNGCDAEDIIWGLSINNKNIPIHWVEGKGYVCHFADCLQPEKFRRKNGNK